MRREELPFWAERQPRGQFALALPPDLIERAVRMCWPHVDTARIAAHLCVPQAVVANALAKMRDADRERRGIGEPIDPSGACGYTDN